MPRYLTVFRSYLRPEFQEEYGRLTEKMNVLVKEDPGILERKVFTAPDGERVTLTEFSSMEALNKWAHMPEHIAAKKLGKEKFYSSYHLQVFPLHEEQPQKVDADN